MRLCVTHNFRSFDFASRLCVCALCVIDARDVFFSSQQRIFRLAPLWQPLAPGPSLNQEHPGPYYVVDMSHQQAVTAAVPSGNDTGGASAAAAGASPSRCIFTPIDMEAFKSSSAKRDLLGFATALGRSCASTGSMALAETTASLSAYRYDPKDPLVGLSPATASLHGSLLQMADHWLQELPPDGAARARFGNPVFRKWHERLVNRSENIVRSILNCHRAPGHFAKSAGAGAACADATGASAGATAPASDYSMEILQSCSDSGYAAAESDEALEKTSAPAQLAEQERQSEETIIAELRAYLHQAFGHPTRLDYGTGHESSFLLVIFCLCKLRCIGDGKTLPPSPHHLAPVALAIFSQYLQVTRGLQRDYMLEPAGSHGVWGLDDYHCLPFYFGACQLQAEEDRSGNGGEGDEDAIVPRSIHDNALLNRLGDKYMYLGCIQYIKELKSSVPFFESSPMLDDISQLPSWGRVSRGLLRLYDGEVLTKLPVVQHFLFGTLFPGKQSKQRLQGRLALNNIGIESDRRSKYVRFYLFSLIIRSHLESFRTAS